MAPMAIWAHNPRQHHPADLCFIAWVADHWAKLPNPMSKLAVISIWACTSFLPFVAQLSLEHPLVIHYHLQRLFLFLPSTHIHLLLHHSNTQKVSKSIKQHKSTIRQLANPPPPPNFFWIAVIKYAPTIVRHIKFIPTHLILHIDINW